MNYLKQFINVINIEKKNCKRDSYLIFFYNLVKLYITMKIILDNHFLGVCIGLDIL